MPIATSNTTSDHKVFSLLVTPNRMPAILPAEAHESWLDRRTSRTELLRMLAPFPAEKMTTYPVSSSVNSPDNDSIDLLAHVDVEKGNTLSLF